MKKLLLLLSMTMLFACTQGGAKDAIDEQKPVEKPEEPLDNDDYRIGGSTREVFMVLQDANGLDLLNRSNANKSKLVVGAKIKLYTLYNGEFILVDSINNSGNSNYTGLNIRRDSLKGIDVISVDVVPYAGEDPHEGDTVSSMIDWGNGIKDIFKAQVTIIENDYPGGDLTSIQTKCGGGPTYYKIWVNDKLVWDSKDFNWANERQSRRVKLVMSPSSDKSTGYNFLKAKN